MKKYIKLVYKLLVIVAVILSFLIFKDKNLSFNNISFYNKTFSYLLISKKAQNVSNINSYIHIKNDIFTNNEKKIYPLNNGTIIDVSNDEIILKTITGYLVKYSNFISLLTSKYDVVNKSNELAYFDDYFTCTIIKNGERINYEEYIKNNW